MKQNRWIIERAGLINFWYYDEEEFNFSDGRLLLRGANGSGKSVTMQSFIPLLLDGNKSPERLDPFGSKARRIENYLLGDEESELEERTAYLYMEFKKKESGNYITIGMGFKAQRGKPIQSWGFAITDGRRIGHNFFLYKDIGDKIPLSKKELENRIGSGGRVVEAQRDYMKMVNDLLFGYDDIDDYDELIKLLVQLRSPKLSKEFRPTVIYEILENSLQPLLDDDLRPMSEAIENMDNIKIRLDELKESKKAAEKIKDVYDKYNRFMLFDKAKNFLNIYNEYQNLLKSKEELEKAKENSKNEFQSASKNIEELKIKQAFYENKKMQLEVHDSLKIKEKIKETEDYISSLKKQKLEKISQEESKRQRERQLEFELKKLKDNGEVLLKKIEDTMIQMDNFYPEFDFDEQVFLKDELKNNIDNEYKFSFVKEKLSKHIKALEDAKNEIEELERINKLYDEALRVLEKAKQEKEYKEKKLNEAKLLLEEIKEELIEKIYTWHKENKELKLSDETVVKISQVINTFTKDSSYDEVIALLREEFNKIEALLNSQILKQKFKKETLEENIKKLNEKIDEWKSKKDPEPERKEEVKKNRERLKEENIPFIPFYKAVDFVDGLSENVKSLIESALYDMGILDALIVPKQYKEKIYKMDKDMADKYIFPSPAYLMHDLTQFLKVDKIDVEGIKEE
ncbi:MAG: TIGR02680 family protein, partial [Caloramator sp.]|nr:TIGR02680 family protein [Caloramator sp.]